VAFQLLEKLKTIFKKNKPKCTEKSQKGGQLQGLKLTDDLEKNLQNLKAAMNNSFDIKTRSFKIKGYDIRAGVIFIENLVNEDTILEHIIKPLMTYPGTASSNAKEKNFLQNLRDSMLSAGKLTEVESYDEIVSGVLSGDTLLCVQGCKKGLLISSRKYSGRNIGEPTLEPTVKGPQEAFVETLKENMSLVRKRLRDPNLSFEAITVGRRSKTSVVLGYIKGIADGSVVEEVKRRVNLIDTDDALGAAQVIHSVSDNPNSAFPLVQVTERPDKVTSSLLEGRIAIFVEGSPKLLIVPVTLPIIMQSPDDYYESWIIGSMVRLLRYASLFVSALFPALYIALTSFHPSLIPTTLTLAIAGSRVGVPFPAIIEALLMEITLELLQEASIRLPRVIGQTVSIVGGLVIGQAAVQAGIISPLMVIVVSITAICSYTLTDYSLSLATRAVRIPFMFMAATFGAFGIGIGIVFVIGYMSSLKSFGVGILSRLRRTGSETGRIL
jgi:hypothetical protein